MNPQDRPEVDAPSAQPHDPRRRRFLAAGTAASPALLTLVSQPALATGKTCFTPSRALSRNTSVSQTGKYGDCVNAVSPDHYTMYQDTTQAGCKWPGACPPSTPFHPTFVSSSSCNYQKPTGGIGYVSLSMGEVMKLTTAEDREKVACHLIAAYLNCMGGGGAIIPANVMTTSKVLIIWQEWASRGYFEPMAGIQWGGTDIKNYLVSNGIVG